MLEDLRVPGRFRKCKIQEILAGLDKKDQQILIDALANPDWGTVTLARELTKRGVTVSETPLMKHRQRACVCYQTS